MCGFEFPKFLFFFVKSMPSNLIEFDEIAIDWLIHWYTHTYTLRLQRWRIFKIIGSPPPLQKRQGCWKKTKIWPLLFFLFLEHIHVSKQKHGHYIFFLSHKKKIQNSNVQTKNTKCSNIWRTCLKNCRKFIPTKPTHYIHWSHSYHNLWHILSILVSSLFLEKQILDAHTHTHRLRNKRAESYFPK